MPGNRLGGRRGLSYRGTQASSPPNIVFESTDPTTYDVYNFSLGDLWLNIVGQKPWMLVNITATATSAGLLATWFHIHRNIYSITGDTGGPVHPDDINHNINLLSGEAGLSFDGTPATSTITLDISGGGTFITSLTGDSGGAVPPSVTNTIDLLGTATEVTTTGNPGMHTLTWDLAGEVSTSYVTDAGTAIPAAGVLEIRGGNNISTLGSTNVVAVSVDGTTQHSLQVGNATGSLTSLGVATDGQLPIGSTGVDPVLSTLTAGSGIGITNAAGSITITATLTGIPLFFAYASAASYTGVTGDSTFYPIPFDTVTIDTFSAMNLTTGQYVVPVKGFYYFGTSTSFLSQAGGGREWNPRISKNGVTAIGTSGGLPTNTRVAGMTAVNGGICFGIEGAISCNAGDLITIVLVSTNAGLKVDGYLGSGGVAGVGTSFYGFLIGET